MKKWNKVYKKNKDIVSREIDDELILMPIYKTNKDINEMYTLNETAAEMWKSIDGELSVEQIIKKMRKKYKEVPQEEIERDVEEFIEDIKKIKAIK